MYEEVDIADIKDPQSVSEYANDCLQHMLRTEHLYQASPDCIKF